MAIYLTLPTSDLVQDRGTGGVGAGHGTDEDVVALVNVAEVGVFLKNAAVLAKRNNVGAAALLGPNPNHAAGLQIRKKTKVAPGKRVALPVNRGKIVLNETLFH